MAPIQTVVDANGREAVALAVVIVAATFVERSKLRKCRNTAQTSRRTTAISSSAGSDPSRNPIICIAIVVASIDLGGRN